MTSMDEQETTVAACRADDTVLIYTTDTRHLKKLRSHPAVTEQSGGEDWGSFRVPVAVYDPMVGFRRTKRVMTEEQKQEAAERMQRARDARGK